MHHFEKIWIMIWKESHMHNRAVGHDKGFFDDRSVGRAFDQYPDHLCDLFSVCFQAAQLNKNAK